MAMGKLGPQELEVWQEVSALALVRRIAPKIISGWECAVASS